MGCQLVMADGHLIFCEGRYGLAYFFAQRVKHNILVFAITLMQLENTVLN